MTPKITQRKSIKLRTNTSKPATKDSDPPTSPEPFQDLIYMQRTCLDFAEYVEEMRKLSFQLRSPEVEKMYAYFFEACCGKYKYVQTSFLYLSAMVHKLRCAPIPADTLKYWSEMNFITRTEALRLWMTTITVWARLQESNRGERQRAQSQSQAPVGGSKKKGKKSLGVMVKSGAEESQEKIRDTKATNRGAKAQFKVHSQESANTANTKVRRRNAIVEPLPSTLQSPSQLYSQPFDTNTNAAIKSSPQRSALTSRDKHASGAGAGAASSSSKLLSPDLRRL